MTTSLQVAKVFNKNHRDVIRAIENKINSAQNCAQYQKMFVSSNYKDASGKANKMYYMNRDGFTFIAFGFTGAKADQFKLKYIDAFNRMEKQLQQQKPLSLPEQISLIAKGYENLSADVKDIKDRMGLLKDFDKVIDFVNNWYPPFELQQEIRRANAQLAIV